KFYNALNDKTPEGTEVHDWITKQNAEERSKGLKLSTTCCMQASLGFNATSRKIPKAGSIGRDNLEGAKTGNYYILAVNEFRAWLTYTFGPTESVQDRKDLPASPGVIVFSSTHIEF